MTARITVVGSINIDLVIHTPRTPQPGETVFGTTFNTIPGGKGANQAVAAARLGGRVAIVGRVGNDQFGRPLLDNLAAAGVDARYVVQDDQVATGVALIVVDDTGQNTIVVASGANMRLSPGDVEKAAPTIAESDTLLVQLENPMESIMRAAQLAHARRVRVILNPAPAQPLPDGLLPLVDVLVPNQHEAALLSGLPVNQPDQAAAAARVLLERGARTVVITLAEQGALFASGGEVVHVPAFKITAVDTTAAGDAFIAGLALSLSEGHLLAEAVRRGNAAGALAAMQPGAQPSLPTRQALERLLTGG
jgi:ribokinase